MKLCQEIIILHGWGSRAANWKGIKESLERDGYDVFIPDLPGFGNNPPPAYPWRAKDYADWLNKWSDEHGLTQFCLVGHSFGGGVAAIFAAEHPHKVSKLILIAAAIVRHKTIKQVVFRLISKIAALIFLAPPLIFFRSGARKLLYKLIGAQDYYRLTQNLSDDTMKSTFKNVIREDLSKYLKNISSPTLIVWGGEDRITPLAHARAINSAIVGSRLKILVHRGHDLNLKNPKELAGAITAFLIA